MRVRAGEATLGTHAGKLLLAIEHDLLARLHSRGLHSWLRCAGGAVEVGGGIAKAVVGRIHGWRCVMCSAQVEVGIEIEVARPEWRAARHGF